MRQKYKVSSTKLEDPCNPQPQCMRVDNCGRGQTGRCLERVLTAPDLKVVRPKDNKTDGII